MTKSRTKSAPRMALVATKVAVAIKEELAVIGEKEARTESQVVRLLLEDALVAYRKRGKLETRSRHRRAASPARAAKPSVEASNA